MDPLIVHPSGSAEFMTPERCRILETWNTPTDPDVSIARARVAPGTTTQLHSLNVDERYLVLEGRGVAKIGQLPAEAVGPGDLVAIPSGTPQQITNEGDTDLLFYCICSPKFDPNGYESLE